ncbi:MULTISPECIES: phosphate acyltransferase PlsX [unclassified Anaerotruncus]|jgi:glycerol-3-phosphate acyltransferase PlsX|uniref:phosphate acyltransferase PlsX n=1 Tax=unclassified Anaerotruncus TaxID=2641626 RepID=UPI000337533A|nr:MULTISPECIES: phosphate acyltransferase PlsX [unclassified Anaerotruncus]MCI9159653.1 phosphate acyltransferase PlsX [Anaerotruncus sp.]RKJ93668.1 phosphate acyltransferase PlsX [Anaerotruncus sp. 1XD22-93]EOS61600.1 fatty acid/phospholipid synthesis protein PlsX [Anaerotruncus sp. G3(2012)]MCI9234619.1 phosphate acyltransferase PlsX [Anaerotruncus sp.]NBK17968.1 phosphate acyltransferase PlsX [Anaerotruncus sp. 1XD42-93]
MRIIVDAFGGDNAPLAILQGCEMAVREYGVDILAVGSEKTIREVCGKNNISLDRISIIDVEKVMPVEVDAAEVVKSYDDSTLAVGLKMLANREGDAYVSAGSTGAVTVGASLFVKRIKGIKRAALATIIPNANGCYMLIDIGANKECRPEMLVQFGIMGSAYMEHIIGVKSPRVGTINIGAEDNKGLDLQKNANEQMKHAPINFIGNVEPRYLPQGACDVAVCDGFTGNVVLKLTEGLGKWFANELKGIFMESAASKLGYLFVKGGVSNFKSKMDYKEYGGAPLMGISRPVIKAHGSSDARAFKNAIRQAKEYTERGVIAQIESSLEQMKQRAVEQD